MAKEEITIKEYELAYLAQEEDGANLVRTALVREGGEIFSENPAERITLAYKIAKQSQAYFGWFHFRLAPEALKAVDYELKTKPGILRFLIITPPFVKDRSKPVSRQKQGPASVAKAELVRPAPQASLSNEELERKIEEILQE